MGNLVVLLLISVCFVFSALCDNATETDNATDFVNELVDGGRTLVHNTLKRFMLIAPAIFFKMGIAFTLLLLVTLVAANNGFIGFLILVVGLSSVLARFQGRSAPLVQHVPVPYASLAPIHAPLQALPQVHHHPWLDRSDAGVLKIRRNGFVGGQAQAYDSNSDMRNTGAYFKDSYDDKTMS